MGDLKIMRVLNSSYTCFTVGEVVETFKYKGWWGVTRHGLPFLFHPDELEETNQ